MINPDNRLRFPNYLFSALLENINTTRIPRHLFFHQFCFQSYISFLPTNICPIFGFKVLQGSSSHIFLLAPVFLSVSSVSQLCLILCNPLDCSTPGFLVYQQLWEVAQTLVYRDGDAIQPSHPLSSPSPPALSFPASGPFPMSQFFTSGGQSIGVSASVLVLPMNIQYGFPSGLTGWVSLQSKGLSRFFSNTTVKKHQFLGAQLSLQSKSHIRI